MRTIPLLITDTFLVPKGLRKPRLDNDTTAEAVLRHAVDLDGKPLGRLPAVNEVFRLDFHRPEIQCERMAKP